MLREITYTALFGATGALDAFYTAFRVPNLLRDLFAEGALSQAYTSVAAKEKERNGDDAAWELTRKVATQLTVLMTALVTLGVLFAGPLMELLYTNSKEATELGFATGLSQIMWPFIGFASLSALVMGALNIVGVFGLPMLASAAFNIVSILLGLALGYFFDPSFGVRALYGFAIGVTIGGAAQLAVQLPRLRKAGFRWGFDWAWKTVQVRKIWGLMIPSVIAAGVTQINVFINTGFALELKAGSVTALTTAFRLWQLPVGLFGVATGMVVLPAVSRMMVGDGRNEVAAHLGKALRLVAFFALPSMVILWILGEHVVSVIYQWGRFGPEAVNYTGDVLSAYAIGLLGYAGTKVVQPVFLALEKRWVPMIAALIALSISYALNYSFVRIWHCDASWLALTTSVITTLNFTFYFVYLRKSLGPICNQDVLVGLGKICCAAAALALVCWGGKLLTPGFTDLGFFARLLSLGSICAVGGVIYLGVAYFCKTPELDAVRKKFLKKEPRDVLKP